MKFLVCLTLFLSIEFSYSQICKKEDRFEPIDITMPLDFEDTHPNIDFSKASKSLLVEKGEYGIRLSGFFGTVTFMGRKLAFTELYFKTPSEHSTKGKRFALEIQMYAPSGNNNTSGVVLSRLFEDTYVNRELELLGLEKNSILTEVTVNTSKIHQFSGSFEKIFHDEGSFVTYESKSMFDGCPKVHWLVSMSTSHVSSDQIKVIPIEKRNKPSNPPKEIRVTQNFDKSMKAPTIPKKELAEDLKEQSSSISSSSHKGHDKMNEELRKKLIINKPEFLIESLPSKRKIIIVPFHVVWPWEIENLSWLNEQNIRIIRPFKNLLPTLKSKDLKWQTLFYSKRYATQSEDKDGYFEYIPHIARVPTDFTPSDGVPVTALPIYNPKKKRIEVYHLQKNSNVEQDVSLDNVKICLKYKSEYDIKANDDFNNECLIWGETSKQQAAMLKNSKQNAIYQGMGEFKNVLKGITDIVRVPQQ